MRVLRGRARDPTTDREATAAMVDRTADTGEPGFRAWTPHRQVAFGRRDAAESGYEAARRHAERHGFPAVQRSVGGRAVAYTGTTVAFARSVPVPDIRTGLDDRYEAAVDGVCRALERIGVHPERGEPPATFCPGDHSVQADGKIAGIAQRVRRGAALVAGVVVVADHDAIAAVLDDVYPALGVPFDPESVGSVARAGGPADPAAVVDALEWAFVDDAFPRIERVTPDGELEAGDGRESES
jgi:lipoate-protein ligase A